MPTAMVPRQCLIGRYRPIVQLANKGVNTSIWGGSLVPVVLVKILAKQAIVRIDVSLQGWVIRAE